MSFFLVALVTGLLLSDRSTREYGYALLVLLALAYPALTVGALVLTGIAFFYFKE